MFYEKQPIEQQNNYKKMLEIIGSLTLLFSESNCPYLPYRAHENIFCKYFEAINMGRKDCSADAKKERIGIGLKTWMGQDDQKIAEFGKLREKYKDLSGLALVKQISEYRNERIRVTKNMYGIDEMIYHIVKRVPGTMKIMEHVFDYIDIDNISVIEERGNENNTYFTDGKHIYHFSVSKNTLYMLFADLELLDEVDVGILEDPYEKLMELQQPVCDLEVNMIGSTQQYLLELNKRPAVRTKTSPEQICLRLYATKKGNKYVPEKSGLNQWNGVRTSNRKKADGSIVHVETQRDPNELYISYPVEDRRRHPDFFPPRDTSFALFLPDGTEISAKVCQEAYKKIPQEQYNVLNQTDKVIEDNRRNEGKAIMSNPNKVLGEWLLRKVFELPENTVVTYDMLQKFGIDSVVFTKLEEGKYAIDFAEVGTYEEFYGDEVVEKDDEE